MTISYSGNFFKLILRWKGSLWKTVWKDLLVFFILYYGIRLLYTFGLNGTYFLADQRHTFEKLIFDFDKFTTRLPIMFLLGFYISAVVKRWWEQFDQLSWPDDVLSTLCFIMPGDDDDSCMKRRAVARYLILTAALSWREIGIKVRKRFPTVDHLMMAGLMTDEERQIYQRSEPNSRWFLPIQWVQHIIQDFAKENGTAGPLVSLFLNQLQSYRAGFRLLHCYDWVCIPLVYTQVAAIATYGYFLLCLIARQFIDSRSEFMNTDKCDETCIDYYLPVFTIAEFLFYIGWFKVGQDLMRPFEEADDDFELNYLLDRHIQVASAMVTKIVVETPSLPKLRTGWDFPTIPHTKISARSHYHPPKLHAHINVHSLSDFQPAAPYLQKSPTKAVKLRYF